MKQEIETELSPVVGEPLSDMWRYGCQKFEFGEQRPTKNQKGQDITQADWGFVVFCHWKIAGPEGDVVSSQDFGPGTERRDEAAMPFYQLLHDSPPIVQEIIADNLGGLVFRMTKGYSLEVWPDKEIIEENEEQWRFMPKDKEEDHCVLWGGTLLPRTKYS